MGNGYTVNDVIVKMITDNTILFFIINWNKSYLANAKNSTFYTMDGHVRCNNWGSVHKTSLGEMRNEYEYILTNLIVYLGANGTQV